MYKYSVKIKPTRRPTATYFDKLSTAPYRLKYQLDSLIQNSEFKIQN